MPRTDYEGVRSVIFSLEGPDLTAEERAFFKAEKPFGFILFARNVLDPSQLRRLTGELRECVGRPTAPILVDQEGGRVQRLRAPNWFTAPAFGQIAALHARDGQAGLRAAELATLLIARDLRDTGFSVNCSPCLDLKRAETSSVIGDRAFGASTDDVIQLGQKVVETYLRAGIQPVIKHMPGHGRGTVDSHHELPIVTASLETLRRSDFIPFKALNDCAWGMTAHIVFETLDPHRPATQSSKIIQEVIRGEIGFEGLLLTDDLNMQALEGNLPDRAARSLSAGVDIVLHCSGKLDEMKSVAPACAALGVDTLDRIERWEQGMQVSSRQQDDMVDPAILRQELENLLAQGEG